jgi:hypothetical protein
VVSVRRLALVGALAACLAACGGSSGSGAKCSPGAKGAAEKGAKTGVEGAKTGVKTGVEGVKTFGGAVGGLVSGGSDEAKANWKKGKQKTRKTAREGADETDRKASECP